jgi:hypothetical protein
MRVARIVLPAALLLGANAIQHAWAQETPQTPKDNSSKPQQASKEGGVVTQNGTTLPEAPAPVSATGSGLYAPVATPGAQTFHDKFMAYAVGTFGPRAVAGAAIPTAFHMANPPAHYPREWRQGAEAFGRNYGDQLARESSMQTARFTVGALLHEDFRYRPADSKNTFARAGHALLFTFVDKSDSGHNRLAFASFAGAAAGGYVGNAYLPHGFNDVTHADARAAAMLSGFAANNLMREFEPEIFHFVKRMHLPFPRIPVPEWWTPRDER